MVLAEQDHDQVIADLAARIHATTSDEAGGALDESGPRDPEASARSGAAGVPEIWPDDDCRLAVFGAHLRGQPLHHQLETLGARWTADIRTSPDYRLFSLRTEPPKPGLVPARPGEGGGSIHGELYRLPHSALGRLLATLPAPMSLTSVTLENGDTVVGFGCTADALPGAENITDWADWRSYRRGTTSVVTPAAAHSPSTDPREDSVRC